MVLTVSTIFWHLSCYFFEEGKNTIYVVFVTSYNFIFSATIFAYGQTSSGKTFTMNGITEYSVADVYNYVQRVTVYSSLFGENDITVIVVIRFCSIKRELLF